MQGASLQSYRGRGLPPEEVVLVVSAVADALDYAHERQLLDRDVKPSNILLSQDDSSRQRILLADFGIARWVNDASGVDRDGHDRRNCRVRRAGTTHG